MIFSKTIGKLQQYCSPLVVVRQARGYQFSTSVSYCQQVAHDERQASSETNNSIQQTTSETTTTTTNVMQFIEPNSVSRVPAFRVLELDGSLSGALDESLTSEKVVQLYKDMLRLNTLDKIMFDSHRQGRISFYMTSFGEEASVLGSVAALAQDDWIFSQYREAGAFLYRKMSLKLMLAQCYGNAEDLGKGRQMPIHYGNRQLNCVPVSSPLTTQLPQAAGVGYKFRLDKSGRVVLCYFGEGAASEGDAHAAMNFATTLACPVLFFCRNNQYAISTPASEQFAGDGIVRRALGYGMGAIRVDGNDLFAVYAATKRARHLCQIESRPILIEAMTYRLGHHSTSDDSSAYRSVDEIAHWNATNGAIERVRKYLMAHKLWCDERETNELKVARAEVIEALTWAERVKKLPIETMFDDVYDKLPANLMRQRDELRAHLHKFGQHYPMDDFNSTNNS